MNSTYALVVAAGRGSRFGGDRPKQYLPLGGQTVLRHAVEAFAHHPRIAGVQVVIRPEDEDLFRAATAGLRLLPPVAGGPERQDSVRRGLEALVPRQPAAVLIHDGARPFTSAQLIDRVIAALAHGPAAIPCLPLADTIKRGADGVIQTTVDRAGLWRAQTPQGFHFGAILAAHRAAAGHVLTDDSAVAETAGLAPVIVAGEDDNVKITTVADLAAAERLLAARLGDVRVGQGFDVHAFGEGDIGQHFPPGDPQWRGAPSAQFLRHAGELLRARGGAVAHLDVTIICERPKIGPHRPAMVERIAAILGIAAERVSVKATTTDRLGFTGRGEGVAAQAVATVRLPFAARSM